MDHFLFTSRLPPSERNFVVWHGGLFSVLAYCLTQAVLRLGLLWNLDPEIYLHASLMAAYGAPFLVASHYGRFSLRHALLLGLCGILMWLSVLTGGSPFSLFFLIAGVMGSIRTFSFGPTQHRT